MSSNRHMNKSGSFNQFVTLLSKNDCLTRQASQEPLWNENSLIMVMHMYSILCKCVNHLVFTNACLEESFLL